MECKKCKRDAELRLGFCFDCASAGQDSAAKRTVLQHLAKAVINARAGHWRYVRFDLRWAWERLFRIGDYAKDGTFDWEGIDWRQERQIR
jgi:hypothetical protein